MRTRNAYITGLLGVVVGLMGCVERAPELSPADREVVILRGIEQGNNRDVATVLQLEPNTVAVRYRRALAKLRAELPDSIWDELGDEDGP